MWDHLLSRFAKLENNGLTTQRPTHEFGSEPNAHSCSRHRFSFTQPPWLPLRRFLPSPNLGHLCHQAALPLHIDCSFGLLLLPELSCDLQTFAIFIISELLCPSLHRQRRFGRCPELIAAPVAHPEPGSGDLAACVSSLQSPPKQPAP